MSTFSDNRKRHQKKVTLEQEPLRIPAPQNWTSREAVRRYVFILLPRHYDGECHSEVLFYVRTGRHEITVTMDKLPSFLAKYGERTWITFDVVGLFDVCMEAFSGMRESQDVIWRLLQDCRFWDVTMLARRIHYAETGVKTLHDSDNFETLCRKYDSGTDFSLKQLQTLFCNMIQYAVSKLPIFQTYWGIGSEEDDIQPDGDDLPRPLASEEFARLSYLPRYAEEQYRFKENIRSQLYAESVKYPDQTEWYIGNNYRKVLHVKEFEPIATGEEYEDERIVESFFIARNGFPSRKQKKRVRERISDEYDPEGKWRQDKVDYRHRLLTASAFRRRDQLLCSRTGPLGIGLDCQAAIMAERLNRRELGNGITWNEATESGLKRMYADASRRLHGSRLKNGFRWDAPGIVMRDNKGYIRHVDNECALY